MNRLKLVLTYISSIGISLAAGGIGSLATNSKIPTWYANLEKPLLNPPDWVFGPVWTTLYLLMGTALFLVWRSGQEKPKNRAYLAFAVQLMLNTLWSLAFFGLESPALGIAVILPLLGAIAWNMYEFYKVKHVACYLLVPYLAWVSFATYLTIGIAFLN